MKTYRIALSNNDNSNRNHLVLVKKLSFEEAKEYLMEKYHVREHLAMRDEDNVSFLVDKKGREILRVGSIDIVIEQEPEEED